MNIFKWVICWFNKQHIPIRFTDKDGNKEIRCVRCGIRIE